VFVSAEATLQRYDSFVSALRNRILVKPVTTSALLSALNDATQAETTNGARLPLG
jgi:hypothetical protein